MGERMGPHGIYDPARHESHVVALFLDEAAAAGAHAAVIATGLEPGDVLVLADGAALHAGMAHPVQALFVPEDDYQDFHHAIERGHALLVARPASAASRDAAIAAIEAATPMDIDEHGRNWRGQPAQVDRLSINHATVSRADMEGRAIGGQDEVILDMTGQKMTVRRLSDRDMEAAPFAPPLPPAERAAPLAPPPPPRPATTTGTTYTYGVPPEIVARMSPEEQVMAQPHTVGVPGAQSTQNSFLRTVGGETRTGWRERQARGARTRSYVTERA